MTNYKDIRWRQRFQNLKNAYRQLEKASLQSPLNELERAGLIQTFNFTFELCWKTLKDYLDAQGLKEKFPREVIKISFQNEILENGHIWVDMLDKRNELMHIYSEDAAKAAELIIKNNYFPEIQKLFNKLDKENDN